MFRAAMISAVMIGTMTVALSATAAENWPQLKGDALHSGNAPQAKIETPLGLLDAIPLTDGVYASPAVSDGKIYAIDGSGVVFAIDAGTHKVDWKFATKGGPGNCNNISSPAVIGKYCILFSASSLPCL